MRLPRHSEVWKRNFRSFIQTFGTSSRGLASIACPCTSCQCMIRHNLFEIQIHLVNKGFADCFINNEIEGQTSSSAEGRVNHDVSPDLNNAEPEDAQPTADTEPYFREDDEDDACDNPAATNSLIRNIISGSIHGQIIDAEEPNKNAEIFLKLLEQAKKELYPGCKNATKVSFIVELFQIKCLYGISNAALEAILNLFSKFLPEGHCLPDSLDKVQRVVRDLGLDYVKIHACKNDCVLFFKEYASLETCPICKESRWRVVEKTCDNDSADGATTVKKRLPVKILRYFPLIPRLQRMYMSKRTLEELQWHKKELVNDGKMHHPADSLAWKHVDKEYS